MEALLRAQAEAKLEEAEADIRGLRTEVIDTLRFRLDCVLKLMPSRSCVLLVLKSSSSVRSWSPSRGSSTLFGRKISQVSVSHYESYHFIEEHLGSPHGGMGYLALAPGVVALNR